MNHATNTLTVDDPSYEKTLKTFGQYCNYTRFLERVQSGEPFTVAKWCKEMPREINYALLHEVSNVRLDSSRFSEETE